MEGYCAGQFKGSPSRNQSIIKGFSNVVYLDHFTYHRAVDIGEDDHLCNLQWNSQNDTHQSTVKGW